MTLWFGDPWPSEENRAGVCEDDADQVPTPVGKPCLFCRVNVSPGDRGILMPYLGLADEMGAEPVHIECLLDVVLPHPKGV